MLSQKLKDIVDSTWFSLVVILSILFAGVIVGFETYPSIVEKYDGLLSLSNNIIIGIFVVEIAIRIGAEGQKPMRYFQDPWNTFDFFIVLLCVTPFGGISAVILRLVRVLRLLRVIKALPRLQILVGSLLKSFPSMGYVSVFLVILTYIYACIGVFIFRENDPAHFSTLGDAMINLFHLITLEDWTDMMHIAIDGCDEYFAVGSEMCITPHAFGWTGAAYYMSFIMIGSMLVLNLFIGVILTSMEEAHRESELQIMLENDSNPDSNVEELTRLRKELQAARSALDSIGAIARQLEAQIPEQKRSQE